MALWGLSKNHYSVVKDYAGSCNAQKNQTNCLIPCTYVCIVNVPVFFKRDGEKYRKGYHVQYYTQYNSNLLCVLMYCFVCSLLNNEKDTQLQPYHSWSAC